MAVRTIGTDIKLSGEKEFNDGMKSINNNLKNLKSAMAVVSAEFDENANSVEALTAKEKILQETVDQQRVKVDALRKMYEDAAASAGESSAAADKYKQQLNNATVAMLSAEKALRKNNSALEAAKTAAAEEEKALAELARAETIAENAIEDLTESANDAENAVEDLADANADVARTAERAADELDDMSDKAEKTGNILPAVARGFGTVATGAAQAGAAIMAVGAGLGTAAITAMVSFAKESAEAAKAAAEAGETLTETQKDWLAYADKLDTLDAAAAKAKRAVGGIILPQLKSLSTDGADYLNNFAQSMEEAAGDTEKQAEVISEYMVKGAELLLDNLPAYINTGKVLLGGIKDGFLEMLPEIKETLKESGKDFVEGLKEYGPHAIEKIVTGISNALPGLGAAAGDIIGELAKWLLDPDTIQTVLNAAWSLGEALANAIWNALKGVFLGLVNLNELIGPISGDMDLALSSGNFKPAAIPGHAGGLDRVPFDNYLARLHKDEMVLTAAEAARYRSGRGAGTSYTSLSMPIYVQTLTPEQLEQIWAYVNERFGEGM